MYKFYFLALYREVAQALYLQSSQMINLEISRTNKFIKVTGNKVKVNKGWGLTVKWSKRPFCGDGILFFTLMW